jgi:hypothetical protein
MWTLFFVSLMTATPLKVEVQTIDGKSLAGSVAELTAERVVLDAAGGRQSFQTGQLTGLSIGEPAGSSARPKAWIALVDGSSLLADEYTVRSARATLVLSGSGQSLDVATTEITDVRFPPQNDAVAAEWLRIVSRTADGDRLVVHKGSAIDDHQGILRDVTEAEVHFEVDGDVLPIKRARVSGLIYYHATRPKLPEILCHLSDVDGARWSVQAMRLIDGNLQWTTPTGLTVSRPLAQIKRIDFSGGGKVVYLSDLRPESVAWTPYFRPDNDLPILNEFYAPRPDRTLEMLPLSLGGKQYRKGIAVHSRTEMTYRLPDHFRRFQMVVGIDDHLRPQGSMRLVIRGDDRVLWEATLTGAGDPLPVDIDVSGVRRLSLLADFAGALGVGDHLLLCEAKVIK